MAAHGQFGEVFSGGLFGIIEQHSQAEAYCAAAERDEANGFPLTAAYEWRRAAECYTWEPASADRCWHNWERLMRLPRRLARAIDEVTDDCLFVAA